MGISSGYPVGAKIVSDLRNTGAVTKKEAERLLAFTNNSGPLYIIGAVGTTLYGSKIIGIFLFACHFIASITVGLLFRFYGHTGRTIPFGRTVPSGRTVPLRNEKTVPARKLLREFGRELKNQPSLSKTGFAVLLGEAVKNSISSVLTIGGFVVLFSVVIQLLTDIGIITFLAKIAGNFLLSLGLNEEILTGFMSGLLEISTGSGLICNSSSAALAVKLPLTSFIIGWAGLSVHSQVISMLSKTDINIRAYLFGKLLHGAFAAFYTWVGLKLFSGILDGTVPANAAYPAAEAAQSNLEIIFRTAGSSIRVLLIVMFLIFIFLLLGHRRHNHINKSYGKIGRHKA